MAPSTVHSGGNDGGEGKNRKTTLKKLNSNYEILAKIFFSSNSKEIQ